MGIPIVAVVDTNSDPTSVDHPIPGNDDSVRSISLITSLIADAIIDGRDRAEVLKQERLAVDAELENQEMEARARQQAEAASRLGNGSPATVAESPDSTSIAEVADVDSEVSQIDVSSASGDNLSPQVEIGHSDELVASTHEDLKVPATKSRDVDAVSNSPSIATPPDKPSTDAEVSGADVDNEDGK
jgi:small subunit ribosomal protein S2